MYNNYQPFIRKQERIYLSTYLKEALWLRMSKQTFSPWLRNFLFSNSLNCTSIIVFFTAMYSAVKKKKFHRNNFNEVININFMKCPLLNTCHLNVVCDKMGSTHKALLHVKVWCLEEKHLCVFLRCEVNYPFITPMKCNFC